MTHGALRVIIIIISLDKILLLGKIRCTGFWVQLRHKHPLYPVLSAVFPLSVFLLSVYVLQCGFYEWDVHLSQALPSFILLRLFLHSFHPGCYFSLSFMCFINYICSFIKSSKVNLKRYCIRMSLTLSRIKNAQ